MDIGKKKKMKEKSTMSRTSFYWTTENSTPTTFFTYIIEDFSVGKLISQQHASRYMRYSR